MTNIKIIDYKAGNSQSVQHALAKIGYTSSFARCAEDLHHASHIILPGVGSARATMDTIHDYKLSEVLAKMVLQEKTPFLGICVGLQVLFEYSPEGDAECLGWLKGSVKQFDKTQVRVPQMGWNKVEFLRDANGIEPRKDMASDDYFYFVNSYYAVPSDACDQWAIAHYGIPFTAAVHRGNIYGMQFHVEKSGEAGLRLLHGFLSHELKGGTVC